MYPKLMAAFVSCFLVLLFAATETGAREVPTDSTIFRAIEKGGLILYLRHGEATIGQDQPEVNFNDCRTQRNLSEIGREQAIEMGKIAAKQLFPIRYPVLSSPYCRARETAGIIFGQQNVVAAPLLASIEKLKLESYPIEKKQQILADLSRMFETPPPYGTNTVIVAHMFPPNVALGEIPNLGTVIIKPLGSGRGYKIVGRISLEQFIAWSNKSASNR